MGNSHSFVVYKVGWALLVFIPSFNPMSGKWASNGSVGKESGCNAGETQVTQV